MMIGEREPREHRFGLRKCGVVFGWETDDDIGPDRDARDGREQTFAQAHEVLGGVTPSHGTKDLWSAALHRQVEVSTDPIRLRRAQRNELVVDLVWIQRAQAQPGPSEHRDDRLQQIDQTRARTQIPTPSAQMNARQDDFCRALRDETLHLTLHELWRVAPRRASNLGNDAERAPIVATVLNLEQGTTAPAQTAGLEGRHLASATKGRDGDPRSARWLARWIAPLQQLEQAPLVRVAENPIDPWQRRHAARIGIRIASREEDLGARIRAFGPAYGLARIGVGVVGDRAGIDHHPIRVLGRFDDLVARTAQLGLQRVGLGLIQPATVGR